jgi:hypothetical protein
MKTSLYDLTGEYAEAAEVLEDLDLPEEAIRDTLESLEVGIAIKAQNVAAFILNLEAEADKIEAAKKRLQDRERSTRNRADWMRRYLLESMQTASLTKLKAPSGLFTISVRQNPPSVKADDVTLLPPEFVKTTVTQTADKTALREALKAGPVTGAWLVQSVRLNIG